MFQRFFDDLKTSTGASLRMTSLVALAGFAGFVALCFLCAAGFIAVLQNYGAIAACLAIAVVFIVIAAIFALIHARKQQRARERAAAAARAAARAAANAPRIDPMMIATGIQVARAIGLKRLVPILGLVGVAVGYMATRNSGADDDDQAQDEDASGDEAAGD